MMRFDIREHIFAPLDDWRGFSQNLPLLNILVHDVINLLYYITFIIVLLTKCYVLCYFVNLKD